MDRPIVYTSEQGRSTDFLFAQRSTMIAIAKLSQAAFGSNTVVRGLAVSPNSPAALNVLVGLGEIYTMADVDATTWGSMAADTDQILQQGINSAVQTISTPAPSTAGYSINYLIEAQFQPQDTNPVVLPFYNSANPQQPLNGQGGNGATLPTQRQGVCVVQAKAGIAATTGTQVTPSVDSGWTALAVVTVANGQVSVGSGNISIPASVPQITSLLQMMQTDATNYAGLAGGTANAITATLSPAPASYSDYLLVTVRVANTNTGSVSLNVNGLGVVPVIGLGHQVLQGGELLAGGFATFAYSTNYSEAILLKSTGGSLQIAPGTASEHAIQLGQVQTSATNVATDTGTANAYVVAFTPALAQPVPWAPFWFKVKTTNSGPSILNAAGFNEPLVGASHAPLQGGELVANGNALVYWNPTLASGSGAFVLLFCSGGSLQVPPATASEHAVQFGQIAGIVGSVRGGQMFIPTASASATWSAKEFVVETALGGLRYCIANASGTINLATTGAGGMDTGTVPTSGYVAIYGIYNPTTQTFNLLATNVTSSLAPEIYGGGHMPSGYTASALISVWLISGSQFVVGQQLDRKIWVPNSLVLNTSTQSGTYVSLAISAVVPQNARSVWGTYNLGSSAITNVTAGIAGTSSGFGSIGIAGPIPAAGEAIASGFGELALGAAQTLYQFSQAGAGTISWQIGITGYSI